MALVKRESDNEFLKAALANFYGAAEEMGLDEGLTDMLAHSERRTCVSIPVEMDDGTVKVFDGYRVLHSSALGPGKGGVRFHPEVCLDECEALAFMMTWKCSLAGIPYGGGKGGVKCNPKELSPREKERIARTFAARIEPVVGAWTDVPAPDVNTGGPEMVWFMDTISRMRGRMEPAIFTGKPVSLWGSLGRTAATGYGVAVCALEALKVKGLDVKSATVAVQGFGNVGIYAAKYLYDQGMKVVCVSNSTGSYYCPEGLDVPALFDLVEVNKGKLKDYSQPGLQVLDPKAVLTVDCDVLLPCALENAITSANAGDVKAKFVVEGANGPTTPDGDEVLDKNGVVVVPDFLANAGGVIGSYFEWCQDLGGYFWTEEECLNRMMQIMRGNFARVWEYSQKHGVNMRRAAFLAAIERVAAAAKMRGVFM